MSTRNNDSVVVPIPGDIASVRYLSSTSSLQACFVRSRQASAASLELLENGHTGSVVASSCNPDYEPETTATPTPRRVNFASSSTQVRTRKHTWKGRLLKRTISMFLPSRPSVSPSNHLTTPTPHPPRATRTASLKNSHFHVRTRSFRFRTQSYCDAWAPVSFSAPWPTIQANDPHSGVRRSKSFAGMSFIDAESVSEELDPATLEALRVVWQNI